MQPAAEQPLFFSAAVAAALPGGVLAAVIVNRLQMRLMLAAGRTEHDGRFWASISRAEWVDELQALRSQRAIMDHVNALRGNGVILCRSGRSQGARYSLDESRLEELLRPRRGSAHLSPDGFDLAAALGNTRRFSVRLARRLTPSQAIVYSQIEFWLERNARTFPNAEPDCRVWTDPRSIKEWHELDFPFLSRDTVKESFVGLRQVGLLAESHRSPDPFDRSLSYTVNDARLAELLAGLPVYRPAVQEASRKRAFRMGENHPAGRDSAVDAGKPQIDGGNSSTDDQTHAEQGEKPLMACAGKPQMARAGKPPILKEEKAFKEIKESSATTEGMNAENPETLDPRILKQFAPQFLVDLFRDRVSRKESWLRLTGEQVGEAFRLADEKLRGGGGRKQRGTLVKEELDRLAGADSPGVPAGQQAGGSDAAAVRLRQELWNEVEQRVGDVLQDAYGVESDEALAKANEARLADQKLIVLSDFGALDEFGVPPAWRQAVDAIYARYLGTDYQVRWSEPGDYRPVLNQGQRYFLAE